MAKVPFVPYDLLMTYIGFYLIEVSHLPPENHLGMGPNIKKSDFVNPSCVETPWACEKNCKKTALPFIFHMQSHLMFSKSKQPNSTGGSRHAFFQDFMSKLSAAGGANVAGENMGLLDHGWNMLKLDGWRIGLHSV